MKFLFNLFVCIGLVNGIQINHPEYYKIHPDIHILGNHGISGKIHSEIAPIATKMIDLFAYDGVNIRDKVMKGYQDYSVLDLCCGVGFSTPFNNKIKYSLGVDISNPMINKAQQLWCKNKNFQLGDAETFYTPLKFDLVQIYFAFHEIPQHGRKKIINNAIENAKKEVIIMDISPNYKPSSTMLLGEPYVEEYLENIQSDLRNFDEHILIPNHVHMWKLEL